MIVSLCFVSWVLVLYLESIISTQWILHSINWSLDLWIMWLSSLRLKVPWTKIEGTHKPNKHMLEQALSITKVVTTMDCTNLWWFSCSLHFYSKQMNLIWDLLLHVCLISVLWTNLSSTMIIYIFDSRVRSRVEHTQILFEIICLSRKIGKYWRNKHNYHFLSQE